MKFCYRVYDKNDELDANREKTIYICSNEECFKIESGETLETDLISKGDIIQIQTESPDFSFKDIAGKNGCNMLLAVLFSGVLGDIVGQKSLSVSDPFNICCKHKIDSDVTRVIYCPGMVGALSKKITPPSLRINGKEVECSVAVNADTFSRRMSFVNRILSIMFVAILTFTIVGYASSGMFAEKIISILGVAALTGVFLGGISLAIRLVHKRIINNLKEFGPSCGIDISCIVN